MKIELELSKSEWLMVIHALGMAGGMYSREGYPESCAATIRIANSIISQVRLDDFPPDESASEDQPILIVDLTLDDAGDTPNR